MTARWARKQKLEFGQVAQRSFDMMAILAVPMIIGTQFVAQDVMRLVAGAEFTVSGPPLKILIIAAGLIFIGVVFSHAVIAINKQRQIIGAYLFTALTAVLAYAVLIPRFSYFGAAWGTVYSEAAIALASLFILWKYSGWLPGLSILAKSLLAGAVMALAIWGLNLRGFDALLVVIPVAAAVYFFCLYLFRGITKNDLLLLFNRSYE
jgi:O-antigen/teichoic acid export membrane protein